MEYFFGHILNKDSKFGGVLFTNENKEDLLKHLDALGIKFVKEEPISHELYIYCTELYTSRGFSKDKDINDNLIYDKIREIFKKEDLESLKNMVKPDNDPDTIKNKNNTKLLNKIIDEFIEENNFDKTSAKDFIMKKLEEVLIECLKEDPCNGCDKCPTDCSEIDKEIIESKDKSEEDNSKEEKSEEEKSEEEKSEELKKPF